MELKERAQVFESALSELWCGIKVVSADKLPNKFEQLSEAREKLEQQWQQAKFAMPQSDLSLTRHFRWF